MPFKPCVGSGGIIAFIIILIFFSHFFFSPPKKKKKKDGIDFSLQKKTKTNAAPESRDVSSTKLWNCFGTMFEVFIHCSTRSQDKLMDKSTLLQVLTGLKSLSVS